MLNVRADGCINIQFCGNHSFLWLKMHLIRGKNFSGPFGNQFVKHNENSHLNQNYQTSQTKVEEQLKSSAKSVHRLSFRTFRSLINLGLTLTTPLHVNFVCEVSV